MNIVRLLSIAMHNNFENPYASVEYEVNTQTAKRTIEMISETMSTVCGYIVYAIVVIMCIVTALDIIFMTIPSYEELLIRKRLYNPEKDKGRFILVSKDAVASVTESRTTGKSAMLIYLVKRMRTYVITVIVLMFMILGSDFVTGMFKKLFSGIYELLS